MPSLPYIGASIHVYEPSLPLLASCLVCSVHLYWPFPFTQPPALLSFVSLLKYTHP